tara:strand:+ start:356 stop:499 length:144 start_codon:yes stop_codon:yes gene_type:complete
MDNEKQKEVPPVGIPTNLPLPISEPSPIVGINPPNLPDIDPPTDIKL